MSTPATTIYACSGVLLTNDYIHTIWFEDSSTQLAYFKTKAVKTFTNYTYVRKSWSLKVESTLEQARTWNYIFFRNGTGKWYYYFITNIEYINDNTVELFLEMDVMQTYLHEYTLHPCFVEREHSATDEIGDNILDEGLEMGDLVVNAKSNVDMQDLCVLVLATFDPLGTDADKTTPIASSVYDGVFGGLGVFAVPIEYVTNWGTYLHSLDGWGKSEGIVSMWMYPKALVTLNGQTWDDEYVRKLVKGASTINHTVSRNTTLDGYTPRNKKLLTAPFNIMYVSNNAGGGAVYRYEKFGNPASCQLRVAGSLSPEGSIKLFPVNYKDVIINYDEGILGPSYPTCAWNQDVYKLWLAQNQHQQQLSTGLAVGTIAAGVGQIALAPLTGGTTALTGLATIYAGSQQIANTIAQRKDMEIQPPQAKGSYSASLNIASEHQTFTVMQKSIDAYHAKILDEYFDLYGYKTHRVKVPNRHAREEWTYTKTIGCHVSGNLCNEDLIKIQNIYDRGITFWVDGNAIGNYSRRNNVLI